MAIEYAFNVSDILSYPEPSIETTMDGPGERIFKRKAVRWLESVILKLDIANTVFRKRAMLLILEAEVTESVLDILLYTESTINQL